MLKLFFSPSVFKVKSSSIVWTNLKPKIMRNINTVQDYYRNAEKTVFNQHILVKTIKNLQVNVDLTLDKYVSMVDENIMFNLNRLDFVTFNKFGKTLFEGIHKYSMDTIRITTFNYNFYTVINDWKNIVPIRVVGHDCTDVSISHPENGEPMANVYMELDPRLLMLQYRSWVLDRRTKGMSINPKIFIYQYPLTNLIPSFLDYSILNITLGEDIEVLQPKTHVFNLIDLTLDMYKLNIFNRKQFRETKTSVSYPTVLHTIKLISVPTALELLRWGTYSSKVSEKWFFYLASLNSCKLLVNSSYALSNMNRTYNYHLYLSLQHDLRTNVFRRVGNGFMLELFAINDRLNKEL